MRSISLRILFFATLLCATALTGLAAAQSTEELDKLEREAQQLYDAQKFVEGIALAERYVALARKEFGEDQLEFAGALTWVGTFNRERGHLKEAEAAHLRVLAIREKIRGPNHLDVAQSCNNLALVRYDQARYVEAETLHKRALAIRQTELKPDDPRIATTLNNLALVYLESARYQEAEVLLKQALEIRAKVFGENSGSYSTSITNLASYHKALGHYSEAELLYKRALEIRRDLYKRALENRQEVLGSGDQSVAISLTNLAALYSIMGRYAEAEPLLKRALSIYQESPGHEESIALSHNSLANLYSSQGRYVEAEDLYQRALAILEKALGPEHPSVAMALSNVAVLYRQQGRYREAEDVLQRALLGLQKVLGPEHPDVGMLLNAQADLLKEQDRYAKAEPVYRRALAITQKGLRPDHPTVALIVGNLGAFLKSEGRIAEAEPLLLRALEIGEQGLGKEHPQVVRAIVQVAELYGLQGRTEEAAKLFARAGATTSVDLKEFPIYFGTNRARDTKQPRVAFGNERSEGKPEDLAVGVTKVIVPPSMLGTRTGVRAAANTEMRMSDVRQLFIQPTELWDAPALVRAARQRLLAARAHLGQALVFVHGYNVSFDNAVRRAGQLAYDMEFDGPVFVFSWPSSEKLTKYLGDTDSARLAAASLRAFLEKVVAETKAKRIHIIAHSMGGFVLNAALYEMGADTLKELNLGELVLASPDLDVDDFQRTYRLLQQRGAIGTVYAASSDWALTISSWFRDRPRLGYIPRGGPKKLVAGSYLIDITAVNSDVFSLNHDIYANSPAIMADLRRLLMQGKHPPDARTSELVKTTAAAGTYWRYLSPTAKR